MSTIEENLELIAENSQTIANNISEIKTNLGLANTSSLADIVTKSESVIEPTGTIDITENGTVDVTNYASANINVSGGGTVESKGIDFIDYDGTLLYSFTRAEAQALTELPAGPTHEGLVFDGWNWTLSEVQNVKYIATIGAVYHTTSGATEFDIELTETTGKVITLQNLTGMTSIDWGDGTTDTSLTHTYTNYGEYTIKVYGVTTLGGYVFSQSSSSDNYTLKEIRLSNQVTLLGDNSFRFSKSLEKISLSNSLITIEDYSFATTYIINCVIIPRTVTKVDYSNFTYCYALKYISLPNTLTYLYGSFFTNSGGVQKVTIPKTVTIIDGGVFNYSYSLKIFDFSNCTSIPSLLNIMSGLNYLMKIIVPDNLYANWKTTKNWKNLSTMIYKVSDM